MVKLDSSVRLVVVQFRFSNPGVIPASVKHLGREILEERGKKYKSNGRLVIEPTENCSLVEFLGELKAAGYQMVDAFHRERIDPKDPRGQRRYHMVRFVFARSEYMDLSDEFKAVRHVISKELREICVQAMWRVRVFLNPFYKDGEEIPGEYVVNIDVASRRPLFLPDGRPVMVWQKDENGKRKVSLKPDYRLCIRKDNILYLIKD
ncbi:hypothetical protein KJA17_01495 [Patescibacteria group bacterium]|nr:hypothetical protein [Patescibacteria group bacterium]